MDRLYNRGVEPAVLDVINIDFLGPSPHPYQTENHTIDDKVYWSRVKTITFREARSALDQVRGDLWGTGNSSYSGISDRVPEMDAPSFGYSLTLIEVDDLKIKVSAEGAAFNDMKRKLRGFFSYARHTYALTITDPVVESHYLAGPDGLFDVGRALLCISLGEPHKGHAYKLIAGVVTP